MLFNALHGHHAFGDGEGGLSALSGSYDWPSGSARDGKELVDACFERDPRRRISARAAAVQCAALGGLRISMRVRDADDVKWWTNVPGADEMPASDNAQPRATSKGRRKKKSAKSSSSALAASADDNSGDDVAPSAAQSQQPRDSMSAIVAQTWSTASSARFFERVDMSSLGTVPASARCVSALNRWQQSSHPACTGA